MGNVGFPGYCLYSDHWGDAPMNTSGLINHALFWGIKVSIIQEELKIPVNSGHSEELMKVKSWKA